MEPPKDLPQKESPSRDTTIAVTAIFASLVAAGTFFTIPLPPPAYEILWSPAAFLALAYFTDPLTSFTATALGGFIGEALNVAYKAGGSPIYPFGMIWATGPEILFVYWARNRGTRTLVFAMVAATVYEAFGFFLSDWAFYTYGLFGYTQASAVTAFWTAFTYDVPSTLVQVVYIPVVLYIIQAAAPAFKRLGFDVEPPSKGPIPAPSIV